MKALIAKLHKSPDLSFKYKWIKIDSFKFNWHCHPEYELMLMHKSRGKRFIGDNISFYEEGDLVFIGSNLPHTWYTPDDSSRNNIKHEAILIQFPKNLAGINFADAPEFMAIHRLFSKAAQGIQFQGQIRNSVADKIIAMDSLKGIDRFIQLLTILDTLGKVKDEQMKSLSSITFVQNLQPIQQSRIDRVCTYLNQYYKNDLRLETVAAIANMSPTAFCRFFKTSTGKSFIRYLNELRIGHACKLLIEGELTISEICFEVGFNNVSNFNRRFLELHVVSPKEYRKEFTAIVRHLNYS